MMVGYCYATEDAAICCCCDEREVATRSARLSFHVYQLDLSLHRMPDNDSTEEGTHLLPSHVVNFDFLHYMLDEDALGVSFRPHSTVLDKGCRRAVREAHYHASTDLLLILYC